MATTSLPGGGDHNVNVYGNGTVIAGDGNNTLTLGSGSLVVGNGSNTLSVSGNATVSAGSGDNQISVLGKGQVSVGGGSDTINLLAGGRIVQTGLMGHDTISLGYGNTSISVEGSATVSSAAQNRTVGIGHEFNRGSGLAPFVGGQVAGGATISGGVLNVNHLLGVTQEVAVSGAVTLLGGSARTQFIGGSGSTVMQGRSGHDTFIGGSGTDTMTGSGSHDVFQFLTSAQGGHHVITNFVAGDQLNVNGHSLSYLQSNNQVTSHDGNTYISADGGNTTIELRGVTLQQGVNTPQLGHAISGGHGTHRDADMTHYLHDGKLKLP